MEAEKFLCCVPDLSAHKVHFVCSNPRLGTARLLIGSLSTLNYGGLALGLQGWRLGTCFSAPVGLETKQLQR